MCIRDRCWVCLELLVTSVIAPTTNVTNNSNTSTVSIMGPQNPDRGMTLAAEAADF